MSEGLQQATILRCTASN